MIARTTAGEVTARRYYDHRRTFTAAPWIAQQQRAKRSMPNMRKALASGAPVVIAGYGDSRTCIGGSGSDPYLPNGTWRDIATSGFMEAQSADFQNSLPLYDHGDGIGALHTHIGWNWDLLRALQARYPGSHQYLNFGIGGTTSAVTGQNGLNPDRLLGLTSSGATIAVIAFGANEMGSSSIDTTANLISIGEACRTSGIDPVYVGVGTRNIINGSVSDDQEDRWVTTTPRIAAASYLDAPYINIAPIFGIDENICLLDPRDLSGSNLYHHDGVYELGLIGSALVSVLLN